MIDKKLAIVLYTSTKGHFNYKDCYKHTVARLEEQFSLFSFFYKVAHIKVSEGEENLGDEMESYLKVHGFNVLKTDGNWKHDCHDNSHAKEYYKDMFTALSDKKLHDFPYVMCIEDDWLVSFPNKSGEHWCKKGIDVLDGDFNKLCVRINNKKDTCLDEASSVVGEDVYMQNLGYTPWGPTYTFQPTIVRTKEWYHSVRLINNNIEILDSQHCEIVSGKTLKNFTDDLCPFLFFNPNKVHAEHIGEKQWIKNNKFN
tara:strand:- start:835 stop:1602 length:768 start_codon:yes stop_codon:yes gene_type:complete